MANNVNFKVKNGIDIGVADGTTPITTNSTTLVTNLNADLLDSQQGSYYLDLANATGTLAIANGGTGQTTANAALNALLPAQSTHNGKVLTTDGTNTSWQPSSGGSVTSVDVTAPTEGFSITGAPITTTGTLVFTLTHDLAAVEGLLTTGIPVRTATSTWTTRSLAAPSEGFTITNADGVAGNPTFVLANDLAAVEGLTTTGIAVRTAADTWATRTIGGTSGRIDVTNGDGVAGAPTIDLATLTNTNTGTFLKIARDSYGRVEGTTAVVASDITSLVDTTYVNVSGDSMNSGANLTFSGNGEVTGLPSTPSGPTAATSKAYVDALVASGTTWRNPIIDPSLIDVVTAIPGSPTTGGTYIKYGGTQNETWGSVTNVVDNDILTYTGTDWIRIDILTAGDRLIIAGRAGTVGPTLSGVGFVNDDLVQYVSGDPGLFASWSLPEGRGQGGTGTEIAQGVTVLVNDPDSLHMGHTYLYDAVGNQWMEIAGPGSIGAGTGLSYSGTTLNVNVGAGIAELPSDEIGVDLYDSSTGAIILTTDGSTRVTTTGAKLHLLLAGSGGLTQDATGLYISNSGVTNSMLANSTFTINGDTGTDAIALGETVTFAGTSAQGVSSTVSANTVTYTVADATTTTKGVASFNSGNFTVTTGAVDLANTTVTPNPYGSATAVGTFTVDAKGRLTAAADVSIQIAESQVTNLTTDLAAKYDEIVATNGNIATFGSSGATLTDSGVAASSLVTTSAVNIPDAIIVSTTLTTTDVLQHTVDTVAAASYRVIEYLCQVSDTVAPAYQGSKIVLVHDGTTVTMTEYGQIYTGASVGTFDADINAGNVRLLFTAASTNNTVVKVVRTAIEA